MSIPLTDSRNESGPGSRPPPPKSNWDAVQLSVFLAIGAAVLLRILGLQGFVVEFFLPVPVCLRARSKLPLLSLIPNMLLNGWFVFLQSPQSPYWAGWRNEWALSLAVFGFGAVASLSVSGFFIWLRKTQNRSDELG